MLSITTHKASAMHLQSMRAKLAAVNEGHTSTNHILDHRTPFSVDGRCQRGSWPATD
jgi:hypothetical protein